MGVGLGVMRVGTVNETGVRKTNGVYCARVASQSEEIEP
jgi:hypothetical protein